MASIKTSTRFDHVETVHDCMAGGSLVGESVFIKNLALCPHGRHGLVVYKLKDKVPEELSGLVDLIENARCEDYLVAAADLGLVASMHSIFPKQNLTTDFDEIEIGSQSWQPKVDGLQAQFDALALVNSLDSERVQAFVETLSAGGDAFQLIDAKVLVETTRAAAAEQANAGAILAEIAAREADVDAEAAAALGARATIQGEVDQNEADIAQEIVDRAAAVVAEAAARSAAIAAEVTARDGAIATAVSNLIDSAPGALDTLNELAAALGDDASFSASVTASLAGKQGQTIYLDAVNSAQRTAQNLQSLDTTTSIATHLSDEQTRALAAEAVNAGLVATEQTRALAAEAVNAGLVATEQTRAQGVESTNATAITAKAPKVDPVFTGSAASFQGGVEWSNGKTMQGVDIVGNNHLLLRTVGGANLRLEPAGVVSCSSDISVQNAKKVKFSEATGNGVHAVSLKAPDSVAADVDFVLPGADGSAGQVIQTDGNGALSFISAGGLSAAGNETITGNWTFEEAVVFEEPLLRMPMTTISTAHNSGTVPVKYEITIEHSAYLYNNPGTNTEWLLPNDAPEGCRIALFNYNGTSSNGKIKLFCKVGQTLFAANGTADKGQSGYDSKTNGKIYATMIKSGASGGIWTV